MPVQVSCTQLVTAVVVRHSLAALNCQGVWPSRLVLATDWVCVLDLGWSILSMWKWVAEGGPSSSVLTPCTQASP